MAKGGMGNLMKQAQMMQANLQKAQNELGNIEVEGSASNGQVKITMSCKNEVKKVLIDESLLTDKELLEDLILVAVKQAMANADKKAGEMMKNVTGGAMPNLNMPGF